MTDPILTFCDACDNVLAASRHLPPWRWQCVKHPRSEGFGFVTETAWDNFPPYLYCKDTNGGQCPLYTPRKESDEN